MKYRGSINRRACPSLSSLYGALDSFLLQFFDPVNSAALHPTRSWSIASQLSTSMENSIMEVLHWSLKRSLGLPTLRVPSDSSPYSICLGILESTMLATCPSHLSRRDRMAGFSDWMPALFSTSVSTTLSCQYICKLVLANKCVTMCSCCVPTDSRRPSPEPSLKKANIITMEEVSRERLSIIQDCKCYVKAIQELLENSRRSALRMDLRTLLCFLHIDNCSQPRSFKTCIGRRWRCRSEIKFPPSTLSFSPPPNLAFFYLDRLKELQKSKLKPRDNKIILYNIPH